MATQRPEESSSACSEPDKSHSGQDVRLKKLSISDDESTTASTERRPHRTFLQKLNPLSRANPPPIPQHAGVSPEATAGFFSRLTWGWMTHLLWVGYARPLEQGDLWDVAPKNESRLLTETLMANFAKRRARGGKFPLFWALSDSHFWMFWTAGIMKVAGDTILTLSSIVVRHLIQFVAQAYYARHDPAIPKPHIGKGIGLAVGLFLMQVVNSLLQHHFFYQSMMTGALSRAGLIAAIYQKSLVLSNKSRLEYTNGKITNLMSTDTFRIDFAAGYAHILWASIIQLIVILVILIVNIGPSALAGFGLLLISTPIMGKIVGMLAKKRKQSTIFTDKRVRLMQEILASMRIIKFYAWEKSFMDKVQSLRLQEMALVQWMLVSRSGVNAVAITIPVFATILAFVTYSLSGHALNPAVVFASLTLFNLLRMPLMFLPLVFASTTDAHVALGRIEKMLVAEEIPKDSATQDIALHQGDLAAQTAISVTMGDFVWDTSTETGNAKKESQHSVKTKPGWISRILGKQRATGLEQQAVAPSAVNVGPLAGKEKQIHANEKPTLSDLESARGPVSFGLSNLNLSIKRGELVAIVGAVGSGKSSILSALVGEMRRVNGKITLDGSLGYCAQVPWIQNATVRQNILFGQEFDQERYESVVEACALEPDFELFPHGDDTDIGERGITISGGQKQRLNIARAAYFDADMILLDDPLSAVDAHVGNHLFEKCICGLLAGKTRILVTHQLHILPRVDRILVVRDGQITEQGTYQELIDRAQDFARILRDFGGSEQKGTDAAETPEIHEKLASATLKPATAKQGPMLEERETGAVAWRVYTAYFRSGGGLWTVPVILATLVLAVVANVGNNLWLSYWSSDEFNRPDRFYIGIYASFGFAQAFGYFALGFGLTVVGNRASRWMHHAAVERIIRAPMSFFDTTPQGRIINRFSKDCDTMDNLLSDSIRMFLSTLGAIVGAFVLSIVVYHYFAAALGPLLCMFYCFALYYRASAREIKRLDSILRSSVFAQFGETLTGLATVRAYGVQHRFIQQNLKFIDQNNAAYLLTITNQRWLGLRLDLTGNLLIFVVAILAVTSRFAVGPSTTGLVLAYTMQVIGMIGWMVRQFAEVENNMNATERIYHYGTQLETEAALTSSADTMPPPAWPSEGSIMLRDVSMAYRHGLPLVLKNLSLTIQGGERVGIIGRTGAGKSSILAAIYRMSELSAGQIIIDGIDVSRIGLHELRSKLAIIPQDPVLFAGTIRSNLDPDGKHSDHDIWQALLKSHFAHSATSSPSATPIMVNGEDKMKITLDASVDDEGLNFSLGQRQLLAMARALLRRARILVLDEATSSIDFETDALIQETIRREFAGTTILCIAHRLKTIVHFDKVCVMEAGHVAEFDTPKHLYDRHGIFRSMCERSKIVL
ncbi:ATP-binding cassette transporter yor1 [Savitreella phatthalungensis]